MRLKIITTGGTIDKVYFDDQSRFEVGEPLIGTILAQAGVDFDFEIQALMRKDSLELTDEDRVSIRDAVANAEEKHILVTHGTDTMVETGKQLRSVRDKVIILVGSLQPARFRSTDALFNIGMAIAAVQSKPPGVYVAMNGTVFDIDNVTKNREQNRFESLKGN